MGKREFLQKAHPLDLEQHSFQGYYWSEKLNGMRCYWDGGISFGIPKADVPWSNMDKDERFQNQQMATGLWTMNANIVHAPNWFIAALPKIPLDGELWCRELALADIMSIVKRQLPVETDWRQIKLHCFDEPAPEIIFADGIIDNPHYKKVINWDDCKKLADVSTYDFRPRPDFTFWKTKLMLERHLDNCPVAVAIPQVELPQRTLWAMDFLKKKLDEITDDGGEGIMIRNPNAPYICERTHWIHKMKKYDDAEGMVVGYTAGKRGKEGRLLGMMGNVILKLDDGKDLEISGFKEHERELVQNTFDKRDWATDHPGEECPDWITSVLFPRGSRITFRYRGLTKHGIPNEAHYYRKRENE